MVDLDRLHVLRMLYRHGTVTAAADALHLTPSAVSQQMRALAAELGVGLLERDGRRVRLTPAAHILLGHADLLQAQWEEARADLDAHSGAAAGRLRLASFATGVASFLAPAAARLRGEHPRLAVELTEAETTDCFDLLLAKETDIAVVVPLPGTPSADDRRFVRRPLLDDPQDLLVPVGHRLAGREPVELAEAADESWIAAPDRLDHHQLILAACATAGFTPRIEHRVQEWNAISMLVTHGLGVCLMPRLAPVPADRSVVRIPLRGEPAPSRRFLACVRRGSERQPAVAAGLAALRQVAEERAARSGGRLADQRRPVSPGRCGA
ncbi:LysR substrate-binding domain-containing protein [Allonocardiopsis opalescens]|uniref:DNA-binding transcriptional LysR family regulator n=1 Tax=Allonocardiopsis opalescens TaxID=1144618 RepID=A0A2T0Q5T3_9ACTN|nr:LysR substrate-binding domain-containing protein [Allonocardiopsis opalescens]PRX99071.1 DNA-binding transcriptional LysR family regulator [Allonocardiopsis opalescens]